MTYAIYVNATETTGKIYKTRKTANKVADKLNNTHGSYKYNVRLL